MSETMLMYEFESTSTISQNGEIQNIVNTTNTFLRRYIQILANLQISEIMKEENRFFLNMIQYISTFLTENPDTISKILEKLVPEIEINYISGKSDEYFMIWTKEGLLRVPKPKNPLTELKKLGEKLPNKPLTEIKKEIFKDVLEEI